MNDQSSFTDVPLVAHAAQAAGPVRSLTVSGALHANGELRLEFRMSAALDRVRFAPATCHAQRRDELWRHTCFEWFSAREGEPAYCEFNFSPAGDWAAYAFAGYRAARRDAAQRRVDVSTRASADGVLSVRATLDLAAAFGLDAVALAQGRWQCNGTAIIEDVDGVVSYWAVHHPRAQPDFHDRDGFRIVLPQATPIAAAAHGVTPPAAATGSRR